MPVDWHTLMIFNNQLFFFAKLQLRSLTLARSCVSCTNFYLLCSLNL